mgnify:CR=1 FL=1
MRLSILAVFIICGLYFVNLYYGKQEQTLSQTAKPINLKAPKPANIAVKQETTPELQKEKQLVGDQEPAIDLAYKQKVREGLVLDLMKKGQEAQAMIDNGEIEVDPLMMQYMEDIFMVSESADWDKFIEAVNWFEINEPSVIQVALHQAIVNSADFEIITDLLDKGGEISSETAPLITTTNNLDLIKKLVPLGLDLHGIDSKGKNSLDHAMTMLPDREVFDYLLANNVSVKHDNQMMDALDKALNHAMYSQDAIYFVERLVKHGAPIELSHRQILEKIHNESPKIYQSLQERVPELLN